MADEQGPLKPSTARLSRREDRALEQYARKWSLSKNAAMRKAVRRLTGLEPPED